MVFKDAPLWLLFAASLSVDMWDSQRRLCVMTAVLRLKLDTKPVGKGELKDEFLFVEAGCDLLRRIVPKLRAKTRLDLTVLLNLINQTPSFIFDEASLLKL